MDEEEGQQFSLRVEIGNEAKPGTWAEVLPGLVKDVLFDLKNVTLPYFAHKMKAALDGVPFSSCSS
jgi:hypothetical protein